MVEFSTTMPRLLPIILWALHPLADAAGCGEGSNEARVVDKAVIQRVIADDDMGISRGALGKRGQHAGDGLFHAAIGRVAAHLGVGVKLERKEKKRCMARYAARRA